MTIKVYDNFIGTSGTDLSAHTPDTDVVGGGWSQTPANGIELDGSGAAKWATSGDIALINCGSTDQIVKTNYNAGGADNRFFLIARSDGNLGSLTAYVFTPVYGATGFELSLRKVIAGSQTVLQTVAFSLSNSTTYEFKISVIGTTIKAYVDSVEKISVTDSSISTGSYSGFYGALRNSANGRWYDFTVDNNASGFQAAWSSNSTLTQGIAGVASA